MTERAGPESVKAGRHQCTPLNCSVAICCCRAEATPFLCSGGDAHAQIRGRRRAGPCDQVGQAALAFSRNARGCTPERHAVNSVTRVSAEWYGSAGNSCNAVPTLLPGANRVPDNLCRFGGESHVSAPPSPFRHSISRPRRRMDRRKGCNKTWNGNRWRRLGRSDRRFYRALAAASAGRSFWDRLRVRHFERRGRRCRFALTGSFDPERLN
jgi:hypothetical protein